MSFDYFPPFDYLKVNFSDVWAWSPSFEFVGYETVNFLVAMGSIAIFVLVAFVRVLMTLIRIATRIRCPGVWIR